MKWSNQALKFYRIHTIIEALGGMDLWIIMMNFVSNIFWSTSRSF